MYSVESLLVNSIYCIFPILCYLFYVAYTKNIGEQEDKLILEVTLFTSLYLNMKYGRNYFNVEPIILFNIPLLVAYLKERKVSILLISIFISYYYIDILHFSPLLIIIEYLIYAIMYLGIKRRGMTNAYLINTFVLIKAVFLSIQSFYLVPSNNSDLIIFIQIFIAIVTFYLLSYFILELLDQCENTINLNISMKELEKEKQLRKSLFKITHEIKNPIAVCKGYLDMFEPNNKKHNEKYIPIIKQEIDRTLMLMDDFLEVTKIKIKKEVIDINLLLDDVCASMSSLFKSHNIKTNIDIPNEELYIMGDYNRLKQVFINVIKNAVEAIPNDRKGLIDIMTIINKRILSIYIKDNGEGIDKDMLDKIGEAFYTTKGKGTGLGIFLSKEIIDGHQGEIIYSSTKGEGTIVIIKLPINYKPKKFYQQR